KAVDDPADDIRAAIAEEKQGQNLQLMVGLENERPREARAERPEQVAQVAPEIREAPLQAKIEYDVDQRLAQPVLARIVRPIRRRVGVDMLGRHRRADEQAAIVKVSPVQDLARYRIEER